ncbi:unnamed protein product [Didymodactylos carnosus]|uniref:Uncharacterized protein n=1 Tax=Didymodactylos carnosus TaxID=1234261 RepID=A0A814VC47_9BILA|nr:unnamed protein product [Didymodactylos carnosus]CAF1247963.1 unnamed protein product [Didymodactylos carnosus]CAF3951279.1 unnamed protein product [Didymodactylos carnosus]CAF4055620.1 unnamed protein product [Didymodactylos carnosus]
MYQLYIRNCNIKQLSYMKLHLAECVKKQLKLVKNDLIKLLVKNKNATQIIQEKIETVDKQQEMLNSDMITIKLTLNDIRSQICLLDNKFQSSLSSLEEKLKAYEKSNNDNFDKIRVLRDKHEQKLQVSINENDRLTKFKLNALSNTTSTTQTDLIELKSKSDQTQRKTNESQKILRYNIDEANKSIQKLESLHIVHSLKLDTNDTLLQ